MTNYFAQESLTHVLVLLHLDSIHGPHDGRMQVWDAVGLDGHLRPDLDDTPCLRYKRVNNQRPHEGIAATHQAKGNLDCGWSRGVMLQRLF